MDTLRGLGDIILPVTLRKKNFADVIKVMTLKTGRLFWMIQMGPAESNETLKAEDFL